jgi:hypothetical protein
MAVVAAMRIVKLGGNKVQRLFFDVVRRTSQTYDFHGQYFKNLSQAREVAEMFSFDLACAEKADDDCEIHVRDAAGTKLFSVPVQAPELVFA